MTKIKQQASKDCGIACLASIGQHYGIFLPHSKIREWAQTDLQGTNLLGMLHAANQMGFQAKALRGSLEQLSTLPLPAIAHGVIKKRLSHFIVVQKVYPRYLVVMDPLPGECIKMSWDEFKEFWSGVVLLMKPSEQFQQVDEITPLSRRMWELAKPFRITLVVSWLAANLHTLLGLCMSYFIQQLSDVIIPQKNTSLIGEFAGIMLGIVLIQFACMALKTRNALIMGKKMDENLTKSYYQHLLDLPQRFFDTHRVGDLLARISDAVKIRQFINEALIELFIQATVVMCAYGVLFTVNSKLAWYLTTLIPLYVTIYYFGNRWNKKQELRIMEASGQLENHWVESLGKIRTIKLFGAQEWFVGKLTGLTDSLLDSVYASKRTNAASEFLVQAIRSIFTVLVLWKGGEYVIEGQLSMGELFALFALFGYFSGPLTQLVQANHAIQSARIASDRLHDILDQPVGEAGVISPEPLQEQISLQALSFRYGFRKTILRQINLEIKAGSFTGIVGESGSGKSSLLYLLQKIYSPQSGRILWDGVDLAGICTQGLRKKMVYVPQEIELYTGNFMTNIALGESQPNAIRIRRVAGMVGLLAVIEQFEHGFETSLGENGIALSGGQKQRLGIARALYRQPEVILLDEATAWLDTAAEHDILQVIRKEVKTVVCISHRLNQYQDADCIHVIKSGTCVESGTHTELIQLAGAYFELYSKQNGELV